MVFNITPHEFIFKIIVRAFTVVELFFLVIRHHKKLLHLFYLLILQNIQ